MADTKKKKKRGDDLGDLENWINEGGDASADFGKALGKVLVEPGEGLRNVGKSVEDIFGGDKKPDKKKAAPKKKADPDKPLSESEIEQEIAANPFNKLGQGLANEVQQINQPVEQAISGSLTAPLTSQATGQALADAGISPGSQASQWLNSEIGQANANDAPMAQAMNAYAQAYGQGQKGVQTALQGMGQANALGITSAPEQTWLQDLATHIQSNLAYYGQIPAGAASNLPPALLYYLQQSGTGGGGGAGVVPLSNINVPGSKSNAPALPSFSTAATQTPNLNDTGAAPS